jgi:DNA-binding transcriptional MerR regulator
MLDLEPSFKSRAIVRGVLRIGEVARQAGIATSQVRYYERIGLLPPPERLSGQRRYGPEVLRRLAVIDVAQRAGLRLDEIRVLLEHGNAPAGAVLSELAAQRLPEIDALIDRARRVRAWLQAAQACDCETIDECALFDDGAAPARGPAPLSASASVAGRRASAAPGPGSRPRPRRPARPS